METEAGSLPTADAPNAPSASRDSSTELQFLRSRIRALARGRYADDLEDIASDAWIRLDRALRRGPADNLEALMSRIAWRAWVDFCRHRKAETGALGTAVDVDDVELESPPDSTVDPHALALWRFAVCEWFARHSPRCLDPAKFVFDGRSWAEAAECLKERPNSLAKRWQRCREQFLSYVRADRGELRDLLDYFEGLAT